MRLWWGYLLFGCNKNVDYKACKYKELYINSFEKRNLKDLNK
ncbi:hypothetical protein [Clostridium saccharoperbutylacetonicum]|nr:hypothetical protein [Clostridium saccharoperbutylacetonicum]AQR94512.1 hypothetical protein CLSAP_18230 [Clostridium saccharoperbutylacetonicum]NSB30347.1 hypothetical protein [Clostridium saccharoperbutylacetonicum]